MARQYRGTTEGANAPGGSERHPADSAHGDRSRQLGGSGPREIAADARLTAGPLQHYFDSREDLLRAAFHKVGNDQIETWRGACARQADRLGRPPSHF